MAHCSRSIPCQSSESQAALESRIRCETWLSCILERNRRPAGAEGVSVQEWLSQDCRFPRNWCDPDPAWVQHSALEAQPCRRTRVTSVLWCELTGFGSD